MTPLLGALRDARVQEGSDVKAGVPAGSAPPPPPPHAHMPPGLPASPTAIGSKFSGDKNGMAQQLKEAFPVGTYPYSVVVPDGGIVCSVGKTLVKYRQSGPWAVAKDFSFADHPHPPRSYPQTGAVAG